MLVVMKVGEGDLWAASWSCLPSLRSEVLCSQSPHQQPNSSMSQPWSLVLINGRTSPLGVSNLYMLYTAKIRLRMNPVHSVASLDFRWTEYVARLGNIARFIPDQWDIGGDASMTCIEYCSQFAPTRPDDLGQSTRDGQSCCDVPSEAAMCAERLWVGNTPSEAISCALTFVQPQRSIQVSSLRWVQASPIQCGNSVQLLIYAAMMPFTRPSALVSDCDTSSPSIGLDASTEVQWSGAGNIPLRT